MSNKIQVKYGESEPPINSLDKAELGFDNLNKKIYIGTDNGEKFLINKIIEIGEVQSDNFTDTIQTLFLDVNKTKILYPRTRVEAIKDKEGNELNVILDSKQKKHLTFTVILLATEWNSENKQTISAEQASESNTIIVCSAPENTEDYANEGVYCLEQKEGELVFACSSIPKKDLIANVMILN